jgi:hypothetical protein
MGWSTHQKTVYSVAIVILDGNNSGHSDVLVMHGAATSTYEHVFFTLDYAGPIGVQPTKKMKREELLGSSS